MRLHKYKGSEERMVLAGMITDSNLLSVIAANYDPELFPSKWANIVCRWCVNYWNKYRKPPKKNIRRLYLQWCEKKQDETLKEALGKFLQHVSDEYEKGHENDTQFLIDTATQFFNKTRLRKLSEDLEERIITGDIEEAFSEIAKFNKLDLGTTGSIDPFNDPDVVRIAFESSNETLIEYGGDLGKFFGNVFERDGFVAFTGPEKRGKTFILIEIAWKALLQGRRVLFFEAGDMSQSQFIRRLMVRATRHPIRLIGGFPGEVLYPKSIYYEKGMEIAEVEHELRKFKKPLDWRTAYNKVQKKFEGKDLFRLDCYPNNTLSLEKIKSFLDLCQSKDWIPDVIVIDYADLLVPPKHAARYDKRQQTDEIWKGLRSLSQEYHCLVVTATQSDADSYNSYTITKKNFTESKTKHAHVTAMIGINRTDREKLDGIFRLNYIDRREAEYYEHSCVHVAGCLGVASPFIKSTFPKT